MRRPVMLSLALGVGLLGGILTRYLIPPTVSAQGPSSAPKEIRAQQFTLVDERGKTRGTFAVDTPDGGAVIRLFDGSGREVFTIGPPSGRLADQR